MNWALIGLIVLIPSVAVDLTKGLIRKMMVGDNRMEEEAIKNYHFYGNKKLPSFENDAAFVSNCG